MMIDPARTLFVSGAAGQLGRRVVEILLERGIPVKAGTRDPSKIEDLAESGACVVEVDFDKPETLISAFAGVDRLLMISTPQPVGRMQQYRNAVDAAKQARVGHIAFTSFVTAPLKALRNSFWQDYSDAEDCIAASGLSFTILRNNLYLELLPLIATGIQSGVWRHAFTRSGSSTQGGIAYVSREDCARAAAAVLSARYTQNSVWTISGPNAITPDTVVAYLCDLTGKQYRAQAVSVAELRALLLAAGIPDEHIDPISVFHTNGAASFMSAVTPDVANLTGKAPTSAKEWISAHIAAFAA